MSKSFGLYSSPFIRYVNSKLANVLFLYEVGKRLKGTGVTTYSLHPGAILTDLGVDRISGVDMFGINRNGGLSQMISSLPEFIQPLSFPLKTAAEGAQTTICCAVNEELADESGLYYSDCVPHEVYREELNDEYTAQFYDWSHDVIREARIKK